MLHELLKVTENESLPEMCARFGNFLGRKKPVPVNALLRAIDDPVYASNLITCRNSPGFLEPLLQDPQNSLYRFNVDIESKTNLELIKKATKALWAWSKTGFSTVDAEALKRRENACLNCPNLSKPEKVLQKMIPAKKVSGKVGERTGKMVCRLCGCNAGKKIHLTSESCPDKHPTKPGMTRWEEPLPA